MVQENFSDILGLFRRGQEQEPDLDNLQIRHSLNLDGFCPEEKLVEIDTKPILVFFLYLPDFGLFTVSNRLYVDEERPAWLQLIPHRPESAPFHNFWYKIRDLRVNDSLFPCFRAPECL